ncbi:condensation domain-containing protein [Streptomyces sp. WMMC500]|uniref:condensation domain-containing protein n=1 Tax=Streptomyces sp. WMMC500 TaxID=3015154 RepID=UPI00248BA175|nr:condensation domain-containing protein [Streptomyces sp. WMMC500]WBB60774.1 condensation domain-containing protein [Streptomyces sp. WMMC500]
MPAFRRHPLRFRTGRSVTGPLTWGQLAIWDVIRWLPDNGSSLNSAARHEVPPGTSMTDLLGALRALVERHDSLHTRYHGSPGGPCQTVVGEAEIDVRVREIGAEPVDRAAERVAESVRVLPFDVAVDLPLRPVVLTRSAAPVAVLIVVSHMAVDGWSLAIIGADLAALLRAERLPPPSEQPLQRARYETTDLARSRERKALAYWREEVESLPARMLGPVDPVAAPATGAGPEDELLWSRMESSALACAVRALSLRTGAEAGVIVMAATAALLAARTGEREAGLRAIVSTRFRPEDRRLVGAFNQNAMFRIGPREETFTAFVRRARNITLRAFRHTEYDPRKLEPMIAGIARRRGIEAGRYCFFNDIRFAASRRLGPPDPAAADAAAAGITRRLGGTVVGVPPLPSPPKGAGFFAFLDGDTGNTVVTVGVADRFLASGGPAEFLRDLERLVTRGALTPESVRTLCAAPAPGAEDDAWARTNRRESA